MTWLRLDDVFTDHPKVEALSDAAFRLHVRAMCYCAQFSTDGDVPAAKVGKWAKPKVIAECIAAGVWHAEGAVYVIHDFLKYNPSKADLAKKSEAGAKGAAIRYGKPPAIAHAIAPARDPVPARPDPAQSKPSSGGSSPAAAAARRRDYVAVENLTGILNKTVADAIDEFRGEHPNVSEDWIEAACEEAAANNVRNWKYVKAILIRWGNDGFKADKRQRVGASGSTGGVEPAALSVVGSHPGLPVFDFAAAEKRREDNEARLAARRAQGTVGRVPPAPDTYGSEGDQDSELSGAAL